ncbi:MAG: hypothetical protein JSR28_12165 [Proteobacteria bacterium]|nr:hypothetical protein [Pseudomonadota bacterium]
MFAHIFLLFAVAALPASADQTQQHSVFAKGRIGTFDLHATTDINWNNDEPYAGDVECYGRNEDIQFLINGTGELRLWFTFRGNQDRNGDRENLTLIGDHVWIFADRSKFEFMNIPVTNGRFLNYEYRPVTADPDAVILSVWRGHPALRRNGKGAYVHMNRFNETLVNAKKLEWGFISRDWTVVSHSEANALPKGWQTRRYPIDNANLSEAISWCSAQVASDGARTLMPDDKAN